MNFNNPIPRATGPRHHEASRQRSPRDRDALPQAWKKDARQDAQLVHFGNALQLLQREVDRMRRRKGGADDSDKIRLFLCDSVTGVGQYYLVTAEVDPDQEPAAA